MKRIYKALGLGIIISSSFMANTVFSEEKPGTSDFEFLLGTWHLEAIQSPGTERETLDNGTRVCAYTLDEAYVRCDTEVRRTNGRTRKVISLHNYNAIYGHYESFYAFSNWPIKPTAKASIEKDGDVIRWTNRFEFPVDDGRTEYIRSVFTYSDGVIENIEHVRLSDEPEDAWRLNYRERLVRQDD